MVSTIFNFMPSIIQDAQYNTGGILLLTFVFKSKFFDNILTFEIIVKADRLHDNNVGFMLFFFIRVKENETRDST